MKGLCRDQSVSSSLKTFSSFSQKTKQKHLPQEKTNEMLSEESEESSGQAKTPEKGIARRWK